MEFIRSHPFSFTVICFLVIDLPEWVASIWSLFSSEPLAQIISRNWIGLGMPEFSPYWITIPLGLFMFAVLFWQLKKNGVKDVRPKMGYGHDFKIEFPDLHSEATPMQISAAFLTHTPATRKYFFILHNSSQRDIRNVIVEAESLSEFPYEGELPRGDMLLPLERKFKFEDGRTVKAFSSDQRDNITFVSFTYNLKNNSREISDAKMYIEAGDRHQFNLLSRRYRLAIKVTGEKVKYPLRAIFCIEFDGSKDLKVRLLTQEATRS